MFDLAPHRALLSIWQWSIKYLPVCENKGKQRMFFIVFNIHVDISNCVFFLYNFLFFLIVIERDAFIEFCLGFRGIFNTWEMSILPKWTFASPWAIFFFTWKITCRIYKREETWIFWGWLDEENTLFRGIFIYRKKCKIRRHFPLIDVHDLFDLIRLDH